MPLVISNLRGGNTHTNKHTSILTFIDKAVPRYQVVPNLKIHDRIWAQPASTHIIARQLSLLYDNYIHIHIN